ncbi:MAG: sulfurtransferase-like selenium metabolism protein YedF [Desulfobacteraceae bacterium]|nr:sulfurtransferase-like selenium metabolism protein YedF [Desulfobacteraceae bacterium]
MIKKIDCRTLDCPEPVLKTKELIEKEALDQIQVLVGNDAAVENVSRFLNYQGFEVSVDSDGVTSTVTGTKDPDKILTSQNEIISQKTTQQETDQKILVIISCDQLGRGDDELGKKLLASFVKTLKEMGDDLWRLVFVNHGVKLSTYDSPVIVELKELAETGVDILVCGTCLTHLHLMDSKAVGETTNMLDIVTSMQLADKVMNI